MIEIVDANKYQELCHQSDDVSCESLAGSQRIEQLSVINPGLGSIIMWLFETSAQLSVL